MAETSESLIDKSVKFCYTMAVHKNKIVETTKKYIDLSTTQSLWIKNEHYFLVDVT